MLPPWHSFQISIVPSRASAGQVPDVFVGSVVPAAPSASESLWQLAKDLWISPRSLAAETVWHEWLGWSCGKAVKWKIGCSTHRWLPAVVVDLRQDVQVIRSCQYWLRRYRDDFCGEREKRRFWERESFIDFLNRTMDHVASYDFVTLLGGISWVGEDSIEMTTDLTVFCESWPSWGTLWSLIGFQRPSRWWCKSPCWIHEACRQRQIVRI